MAEEIEERCISMPEARNKGRSFLGNKDIF